VHPHQMSFMQQLFEEPIEIQQPKTEDLGTFKDNSRAPVHRWFQYPAGYSYKFVDLMFEKYSVKQGDWIYDPFSGTVGSKWLKDARHHNDKGAWILQLREISKQYSTVRGAVAILAGYWTEGVGLMLESNAGVRMILVATDEEVYSTLQQPLNEYLGDETFVLDPGLMRKHPAGCGKCQQPLNKRSCPGAARSSGWCAG
jgi:hypothetical protein